ncbi:pupal cuticle protein-like [Copidosoma floridanum]|uniref:pupal cuticle protein-like n=1 Tax=Copidosoma floridanum TaxID=29053 RepID=UPI000C6F7046|nr:pupal cuticle protein-like [Copidosoma floridanum]
MSQRSRWAMIPVRPVLDAAAVKAWIGVSTHEPLYFGCSVESCVRVMLRRGHRKALLYEENDSLFLQITFFTTNTKNALHLQIVISTLAVAVFARPGYHHGPEVHAFAPYHGPLAPLAHDGRVVDTPEVAHAKAAHFHAYADELSKTAHHGPAAPEAHYEPVHHPVASYHHPEPEHHAYHGPPAPLAHDGRVVDTPEVAHAKAAHFHAYAEELSKVSHHGPEIAYPHY